MPHENRTVHRSRLATIMASKGTIRSMRISAELDARLRNLAEEKGESVNAIVEAELTKLVEFDKFTDEMAYTTVRKAWLSKLIEYLSEDEIREFGRWSAVGPSSETVHFYHGTMDLDSLLETYEEIGSKYGKFFTFRHESDGTTHTIVLNHGMGMKWSIFLDANLKKVFRDVIGLDLTTRLSDNIFFGRFEAPTEKPASAGATSLTNRCLAQRRNPIS